MSLNYLIHAVKLKYLKFMKLKCCFGKSVLFFAGIISRRIQTVEVVVMAAMVPMGIDF